MPNKRKKIKPYFYSKKAGRKVFRKEFSKSSIPARMVRLNNRAFVKIRNKFHPVIDPRTGKQARILVPKIAKKTLKKRGKC